MNTGTKIALAASGGYVLGRTKKMKLALALGLFLAGRKLPKSPLEMIQQGAGALAKNEQFAELTQEVRGGLFDAGKAAAGRSAERWLAGIGDRLREGMPTPGDQDDSQQGGQQEDRQQEDGEPEDKQQDAESEDADVEDTDEDADVEETDEDADVEETDEDADAGDTDEDADAQDSPQDADTGESGGDESQDEEPEEAPQAKEPPKAKSQPRKSQPRKSTQKRPAKRSSSSSKGA